MDVPVILRTVEKLRNALFAEDMGYQFLMREQYWLQTISWIADAMGAQRIAVYLWFSSCTAGMARATAVGIRNRRDA